MTTSLSRPRTSFLQLALPLFLAVLAYIPILNNGFIADDYVVSENGEKLKTEPLHLYRIPPENFRTTIHVAFSLLKTVAGYNVPVYYIFNIALHAMNVFLLGYFLRMMVDDPLVPLLASCFFAVFHAPQEAVMWLSGMTESLLALFIFLTLILWAKDRPILATLSYMGALLSKESSVVVLALVPLMQFYRGKPPFTRAYVLLCIPAVASGILLLATWHSNPMIALGLHEVSSHALLVLAKTLHRLLWPWFYIVLLLRWLALRSSPHWGRLAVSLGIVLILMSPYMFITYNTALPSRNLYLASAALMSIFAVLVTEIKTSLLSHLFVVAFIGFNIGFLWIRKDPQFEDRAAPTRELLKILKDRRPERILILGFPYPNGYIAGASALTLPGWSHDDILVSDSANDCPGCPRLQWDPQSKSYRELRP